MLTDFFKRWIKGEKNNKDDLDNHWRTCVQTKLKQTENDIDRKISLILSDLQGKKQ